MKKLFILILIVFIKSNTLFAQCHISSAKLNIYSWKTTPEGFNKFIIDTLTKNPSHPLLIFIGQTNKGIYTFEGAPSDAASISINGVEKSQIYCNIVLTKFNGERMVYPMITMQNYMYQDGRQNDSDGGISWAYNHNKDVILSTTKDEIILNLLKNEESKNFNILNPLQYKLYIGEYNWNGGVDCWKIMVDNDSIQYYWEIDESGEHNCDWVWHSHVKKQFINERKEREKKTQEISIACNKIIDLKNKGLLKSEKYLCANTDPANSASIIAYYSNKKLVLLENIQTSSDGPSDDERNGLQIDHYFVNNNKLFFAYFERNVSTDSTVISLKDSINNIIQMNDFGYYSIKDSLIRCSIKRNDTSKQKGNMIILPIQECSKTNYKTKELLSLFDNLVTEIKKSPKNTVDCKSKWNFNFYNF